jgi:hypothetical protein
MTEFVEEPTPPQVQDAIPAQSHTAGGAQPVNLAENMYQQHAPAISEADSMHEAMMNMARQNSALIAKLSRYEQPQNTVTAPAGGAPVAHHLHLVDGRTVINHGGIGTHWSETLADGSTRITRIKEYYPAVEPDPSTLNA